MTWESFDVALEKKLVGDEGEIEGFGAVFNNVDDGRDVIVRGAFAASLKTRGMPAMLWHHDQSRPVGVWTEAKETARGLHVKGKFTLDSEAGREAYALVKSGAASGLSIGYRTQESEHDHKAQTRKITKADLREVSIVSIPMNDKARVTQVKAAAADLAPLLARAEEIVVKAEWLASAARLDRALRAVGY